MNGTKPEGESKQAPANISPSASELWKKRFVLVATVVATGPTGDVEVQSRSVVVDEWVESNLDAKRLFEEWLAAELDAGSESTEDDSGERFRDDDPWEAGGF